MIINGYQNICYSYEKESIIQTFAINECQKYMTMIFPDKETDISITLSRTDCPDIQFDGFKLSLSEQSCVIEANEERGLLYGVYAFLEKLGCSFVLPISNRETIPTLPSITLKNDTIIENPCIEHRGMCFYSTYAKTKELTLEFYDWMTKNRYNFLMTALDRPDDTVDEYHTIRWLDLEDTLLHEIKQRGIVLDMSEHSTDYFLSRDELFAQHPEWFSQLNGTRQPGQMCYSNKDAVQYYGDRYIDYIKDHPELDVIGIWPLDGGGYCQCDVCTSDPFTFARALDSIAKRIKEINPTLVVEHLAYTKESFPIPNWEMCDNIAVLCCNKQDGIAYGWADYTKNKQGAYYFEYNSGDSYRACANVMILPNYCTEVVNMFANYGYKGIVSLFLPIQSWFIPVINYYYMRKAYWEMNYDKEQATKDLCRILYGEKNHASMAKIFHVLTSKLQDPALWTRFPFRSNKQWYSPTVRRDAVLDKRRHTLFMNIYHEIMQLFGTVSTTDFTADEKLNFESTLLYAQYQKEFFENIDQFDYNFPQNYDVDGFFSFAEAASQRPELGLIPVSYAKWRIVGRDNILKKPTQENYFVAE